LHLYCWHEEGMVMNLFIESKELLVELFAQGQIHLDQCGPQTADTKESLRLIILESIRHEQNNTTLA